MNRIEANVQRFRTALALQLPFYGEIINHIPFYADTSIPTAQTNYMTIRYNPNFFATMTEGQQNYVLMHEVMHILLRHGIRTGEKRPDLWNIACDMVVNQILDRNLVSQFKQIGLPFQRPEQGVFASPTVFYGKAAETIYEELQANNPSRKKKIVIRIPGRYNMPDQLIELEAHNDLDSARNMADISVELNLIMRRALAGAQGRSPEGSFPVPALLLQSFSRKPLPWKTLLKNLMQELDDDDDSSWTTPERKYIHMDLLLPGHCRSESETLGEVWAFVDSSGSIGQEEMKHFLNELWHLLHDFHCTMNLAYWDTQVTDVYTGIQSEKKLMDCMPKHSGGTDINCVYRYIAEKKLKPEVLIILTDGFFGTLHDTKPLRTLHPKTVMVLTGTHDEQQFRHFGRIASL